VVYVGHDGLLDFTLTKSFQGAGHEKRDAIVLACASKSYFHIGIAAHWRPTLAVDHRIDGVGGVHSEGGFGWVDGGRIHAGDSRRAAAAYAKYQKCSTAAAQRLFATGW